MTTEDLFQVAVNGPGLLGFMAKHFINSDLETKKEFLLNLRDQIPKTRSQMVQYYGEDFVYKLESFQ